MPGFYIVFIYQIQSQGIVWPGALIEDTCSKCYSVELNLKPIGCKAKLYNYTNRFFCHFNISLRVDLLWLNIQFLLKHFRFRKVDWNQEIKLSESKEAWFTLNNYLKYLRCTSCFFKKFFLFILFFIFWILLYN